jgi:hypothetical protein
LENVKGILEDATVELWDLFGEEGKDRLFAARDWVLLQHLLATSYNSLFQNKVKSGERGSSDVHNGDKENEAAGETPLTIRFNRRNQSDVHDCRPKHMSGPTISYLLLQEAVIVCTGEMAENAGAQKSKKGSKRPLGKHLPSYN